MGALQTGCRRCGPWFDRLTMRPKTLKLLNLILSLSKDKAWSPASFSVSLLSCGRLFLQKAH